MMGQINGKPKMLKGLCFYKEGKNSETEGPKTRAADVNVRLGSPASRFFPLWPHPASGSPICSQEAKNVLGKTANHKGEIKGRKIFKLNLRENFLIAKLSTMEELPPKTTSSLSLAGQLSVEMLYKN
jgi:hypothetical protein